MSAFTPWTEPHQKADEPTRYDTRKARKATAEEHWRAVCRHVDARDGYRCRVCGRRCSPDALTLLEKAQRHHIQYRSAGGNDQPGNLILLCAGCHADEHAHRLKVDGDAEDGTLEVWRRDVMGAWFLSRREVARGRWEHD